MVTPYKYKRAIGHFWAQMKLGYARRHYFVCRTKAGAKEHLLQGAFGKYYDGQGAPDCGKLFRHEEDELQEGIDQLEGYLLPPSTSRDLHFTAAAKALPFVKAFNAATKNPSWDAGLLAVATSAPSSRHSPGPTIPCIMVTVITIY